MACGLIHLIRSRGGTYVTLTINYFSHNLETKRLFPVLVSQMVFDNTSVAK